jgi:serine/threonine protein kinase
VSDLSDAAIARLREVVERPETGGPSARYEIVRRIGQGGMGAVYLAHDRELDRNVALKVLRAPEPTEEEQTRILREARILASLEHPGIVPVHDVGFLPPPDGRVFYVMKHVRGERLDEFARREPPPQRSELLRVFLHVCEAVAFAHAAGVVHRDLKPQNVMLGAFGEVLVLDWGVAKTALWTAGYRREADAAVSGAAVPGMPNEDASAIVGTPGYMAPEQLEASGAAVDGRTDVYGLGGILHFLLTGSHPSADPEQDSIPGPLRAIRDRAREPARESRYASASDLATDVRNFLDALPVTAHREGMVDRLLRLGARHRTAILLVLAYLVMRVLFLVFGRR